MAENNRGTRREPCGPIGRGPQGGPDAPPAQNGRPGEGARAERSAEPKEGAPGERAARADRGCRADLALIEIDPSLAHAEKMRAFLSQIGDPYRFRCGEVPVQLSFAEGGPPLGEALGRYFLRLKRG